MTPLYMYIYLGIIIHITHIMHTLIGVLNIGGKRIISCTEKAHKQVILIYIYKKYLI